MSGTLNKVLLIGRLGRDPELRYTPNGTPVASFSIATDESWTSSEGHNQTRTEWHNITAWNKLAEICGKYLVKGKLVYIEGKIQTEEWEKDGQKQRRTKIVAQKMLMLGSKGGSSESEVGNREEQEPGPDEF